MSPSRLRIGLLAVICAAAQAAQSDWDAGNPTAMEQAYIELINRARMDPTAEGQRLRTTTNSDVIGAYTYFGVDTTLMANEFAAIPARPPLATHPNLRAAARSHAQYLFDNALQSHTGSGGSILAQRLTAASYTGWSTAGENVFSYAKSAFHGHAGFEVDWGFGADGMQSPRGHRNNIHNGNYTEIGVGVIEGTNTVGATTVGSQVVTQDFAARTQDYLLGVVYDDLNSNVFYDSGEGATGVSVTPSSGSSRDTTLTAGAYAFPVGSSGSISVLFSHPSWGTVTKIATLNGNNVKLDARRSEFSPSSGGSTPATPTVPPSVDSTTSATPTLGGSTIANANVTIYDGVNPVGVAIANASGVWSWTSPTLTSGSHSFTWTASNGSGTSGASPATVVTVSGGGTGSPAAPSAAGGGCGAGGAGLIILALGAALGLRRRIPSAG